MYVILHTSVHISTLIHCIGWLIKSNAKSIKLSVRMHLRYALATRQVTSCQISGSFFHS